jgi:hypothetical protein
MQVWRKCQILFEHTSESLLFLKVLHLFEVYMDLFDWRLPLLGNSNLNTPMHTLDSTTVGIDTLTTSVLLVTIVFASQSLEAEEFIPRSGSPMQCNSNCGIQEATSAVMVSVIITCSSCKSQQWINPVTNPNHVELLVTLPHLVYVTILVSEVEDWV